MWFCQNNLLSIKFIVLRFYRTKSGELHDLHHGTVWHGALSTCFISSARCTVSAVKEPLVGTSVYTCDCHIAEANQRKLTFLATFAVQ